MANATCEAREASLRVAFDRRLKLGFHGARIDGRREAFAEFLGLLDAFPFWFNVAW